MGRNLIKFIKMSSKIDEISFIIKIKEILDTEIEVKLSDKLESIEDYDSLTQMVIASWIASSYNISCKVDNIQKMNIVNDIFEFINS